MACLNDEATVFGKPTQKWSDMHGMEQTKRELKFYATFNGKFASNGVLLFGPPGTGKTALAKGLANEFSELHFISLPGKKMRKEDLQAGFNQAREHTPSILHIENSDVILSQKSKYGSKIVDESYTEEFAHEMQLIFAQKSNVLVLIESNAPWDIDRNIIKKYFPADIYIPNTSKEDMRRLLCKSLLKTDRFGDELNKQSFSSTFLDQMIGFNIQHVGDIIGGAMHNRAKRYFKRAKCTHVQTYIKSICNHEYEWIPCNSSDDNPTLIFSPESKLNIDLTKVFIPPEFPLNIHDVSNAVNETRVIKNISTAHLKNFTAFHRELYSCWTPYKVEGNSPQGSPSKLLSILHIGN